MSTKLYGSNLFRGALTIAVAVVFASTSAVAQEGADSGAEMDDAPELTKAVAVLTPTAGNEGISGTVTFTQEAEGVRIVAHINGLEPNSEHGFHIHEFGDISAPDGTSAGGHFNPAGTDHGGPDDAVRHVGDLGNVKADGDGHAMLDVVDKQVQIHGEHSILGRCVVLHGGADDLTSQPSGAAGPRIAAGVIGVGNSS